MRWIRKKGQQLKAWWLIKWARFKRWITGILVSLGLIAGGIVIAADSNLSWVNATQYEDGTPLPVEEIAETVIYKQSFPLDGAGMADPRNYVELDRVAGTVTNYVDANVGNGVHCYVATHVATNGSESQYSGESCKTVDQRIPGAPESFSVN